MSTLGEVAHFIMGQAPPGKECNSDGIGTPFVKAGEFTDHEPIIRQWTTKPLKLATREDVLVCVVGATSGKICLGADCAIGRSVAAVRPINGKLNQKYLYYFLETHTGRLRGKSQGVAQGVITKDMLSDVEIPLPPLPEQKRIADILDKADTIRRKRQEVVEVSASFLLAAFLDRFGDPRTNPNQWPSSTMGESLDLITYGLTVRPEYVSKGYRLVSAREIRTGFVDLESAPYISGDDFEKLSSKGKPEKGDILFSKTGSIGHCAEIRTDEAFALTQNAARLRFKPQIEPTFALYYLRSPFIQALAQSRAKGNAVRDLQLGDMKTFPIYVPPKKEQRQFVEIARKIEDSSKRTQSAHESTKDLFNSLVQRAFKGEL